MSSTVKVHMKVCGKVHVIEVTALPGGNYGVKAVTECDHVKEFVELVNELSIADLTDKRSSKVWEAVKISHMSATCLVPAGIMNAAWLEAGLLSKNLAKSAGSNSVEFV
ncbi:MAG: hypothetical protein ABR879_02760 [Methanomassiliicoccales archaeon]|jgi:hypothetical protein